MPAPNSINTSHHQHASSSIQFPVAIKHKRFHKMNTTNSTNSNAAHATTATTAAAPPPSPLGKRKRTVDNLDPTDSREPSLKQRRCLCDRDVAASRQKLRPRRQQLRADANSGFLPRRPNNVPAPSLPMFYRACSRVERAFPRHYEETVVGIVRSIVKPCRASGWLRHIARVRLDVDRRNAPQHDWQVADRWAVPLGLARSI